MEGKSQLLSNLIVNTQQRLVLVIDEAGHEKQANRILRQWLNEQGITESNIHIFPLNNNNKLSQSIAELRANAKKLENLHVLLPTLADLLCYLKPSMIFELLHELRNCPGVQSTLIWASIPHLIFPKTNFFIAACEYICDTAVHILDEHNLRVTARKRGGAVNAKHFSYKINKNEFIIKTSPADEKNDDKTKNPNSSNLNGSQNENVSVEHGSTFKIELEEEELVARNAIKLPYEKTTSKDGGNIVYTPDVSDDFDEEDPDEDLCI